MDYENSTHVKSWTFTPQQLKQLRARANQESLQFIETQEQQSSSDAATGGAQGNSESLVIAKSFAKDYKNTNNDATPMEVETPATDSSILTPEEETTLIDFYSSKLLTLIGPSATHPKLKRDIKVASTASLLLKRFYLSNSITLFDPKTIMVASAFLASKVEDVTCDVRYIEDGTRAMQAHVKIKEIIEAEIALVKGVDFDLCCFHPYKVVLAYTEDLRSFLKSKDGKHCVTVLSNSNDKNVNAQRELVSGEDLRPIYDKARDIVQQLVFGSDVMLLASPGKIGLVAMMLANKILLQSQDENFKKDGEMTVVKIDFREYLRCRFAEERKEHEIDALWQEIEDLSQVVQSAVDQLLLQPEPDMVALKGIHKKLKKSRIWGKDDKKKKKKKRKHGEGDGEK
jgi:hypothetical protein